MKNRQIVKQQENAKKREQLELIRCANSSLLFKANSANACGRACRAEVEFLCRSFLYLGPPTGKDYNCKLYHMDHWTLPDGVSAFSNSNSNSISDGTRIGNFYENRCRRKWF